MACDVCQKELEEIKKERDKALLKLKEMETLGATGQYTHGRVGPDDQGELKAALYTRNGKLVLDFGKQLSWLAMTRAEAQTIAVGLLKKSEEIP